MVESSSPTARRRPSGENSRCAGGCGWSSTATAAPPAMRVTRTVLSYDPVASSDSSRDSAATTTPSVWPSTTNRVEAVGVGGAGQ